MGAGEGIPVRLTGPDDKSLDSVEAWKRAMPARVRDHWDKSAREIAESWAPEGAMPPEVAELLGRRDELADLAIDYARPEGTTAIDRYPGGDRSHDLLLAGTSAAGTVVIGVEAKADEPFDVPVARYRERGLAKRTDGENTNAPERLAGLIDCLFPAATRDPAAIDALGYQLLSGAVGVLAEAQKRSAALGVFLVQEFGPGYDERKVARNAEVLESFLDQLPGAALQRATTPNGWLAGPFACPGNDFVEQPVPLLVGKVQSPAKVPPGATPALGFSRETR